MPASRKAPVHAVVGAGYGDEGKGVATDVLAARYGSDAVVVRANSGAQAGHTVTTPDGRRHVFHHVGSGSFAGAATFLGPRFVSNPMLLGRELEDLALKDVRPRILADARGLASTPYDVMLNQFVETDRAGGRHGSCGIGFGETIERNLRPEFALALDGLRDPAALRAGLDRIRRLWLPERAARLGIALDAERESLVRSDEILERYVADAQGFLASVDLVGDATALPDAPLIFENAQGLLLDQVRGAFPFVTRSNTGLRNILETMREIGAGEVDVVYATRAYVTRHGAGPLAWEEPEQPWRGIVDRTNVPNPWQGTIRYGLLDVDILAGAIHVDLADAGDVTVRSRLAVGCLDQIEGAARWIEGAEERSGDEESLLAACSRRTGIAELQLSRGPDRTRAISAAFAL